MAPPLNARGFPPVSVEIRTQRGYRATSRNLNYLGPPSAQLLIAHCNLKESKLVRSGRAARLRVAQEWQCKCLLRGEAFEMRVCEIMENPYITGLTNVLEHNSKGAY